MKIIFSITEEGEINTFRKPGQEKRILLRGRFLTHAREACS